MEKCVKGITVKQNITEKDNIDCYDKIRDVYDAIYDKLNEHFPSSLLKDGFLSELRGNMILDKATKYVIDGILKGIFCNETFLEDGIDFMYELIEMDRQPASNDKYFVEVYCNDVKALRNKLFSLSKEYTISTDPLQLTIKSLCKDSYKNGNITPEEMSDDIYNTIYNYIHESDVIDYEVDEYFITNSI